MSNKNVIICFPYAGGGKSSFDILKKHLSCGAKVLSLTYSGRESESDSAKSASCFNRMLEELKSQLSHIDAPITFFGHSMGAIVAYELTVILSNQLNIRKLVVSACKPPKLFVNSRVFSEHSDDGFRKIVDLGGIPQIIAGNPTRLKEAKSRLANDLRLLANYKRQNYPKIHCAIHALAATDDSLASENEMLSWKNYTLNEFKSTTFKGDHFYFRNKSKEVAHLISQLI
ncbi:thioesterase II family protein [Serratia sp. T13T92]|uniref:thioesterase II family protein n=1 Tax=Serratia sp. T13T92 TaxID=3397496 RepID=UPI0039E0495A